MADLDSEGHTTHAELVEFLEAELEADFSCPLTLVRSYPIRLFISQIDCALIDSLHRQHHLTRPAPHVADSRLPRVPVM